MFPNLPLAMTLTLKAKVDTCVKLFTTKEKPLREKEQKVPKVLVEGDDSNKAISNTIAAARLLQSKEDRSNNIISYRSKKKFSNLSLTIKKIYDDD